MASISTVGSNENRSLSSSFCLLLGVPEGMSINISGGLEEVRQREERGKGRRGRGKEGVRETRGRGKGRSGRDKREEGRTEWGSGPKKSTPC